MFDFVELGLLLKVDNIDRLLRLPNINKGIKLNLLSRREFDSFPH